LIPFDEKFATAAQPKPFLTSFCERVNRNGACAGCAAADRSLRRLAGDRPETITCFAGMAETGIPVRSGGKTIAILKTGQAFVGTSHSKDFSKIRETLIESGMSVEEADSLEKVWLKTPNEPVKKYEGAITVMADFAQQLSDLVNRLVLENTRTEPDPVVRAKRFVSENIEDKICLDSVARHVGVSPYYFCKLFKETTRMTLTEYINRRRVEKAKQLLMHRSNRITEIAFEVGYQSLSQFNRSFLKYVGVSPTGFREKETASNFMKPVPAALANI